LSNLFLDVRHGFCFPPFSNFFLYFFSLGSSFARPGCPPPSFFFTPETALWSLYPCQPPLFFTSRLFLTHPTVYARLIIRVFFCSFFFFFWFFFFFFGSSSITHFFRCGPHGLFRFMSWLLSSPSLPPECERRRFFCVAARFGITPIGDHVAVSVL